MKIDHIAMYVNNLEAAKEFFIKCFNFICFDNGARLEI